ncbi:acyl carrier protein [Aureicoccus marinus]|jgi:acyl carrier protein|uniref:Acyl carrier protein n=1 Tax=Aureicoccus marinus TaxID=754435 RepID=A0A2S7TB20_9FLAO|nr:phosphopantetheine-binding protein [Aureicoccus marinus]PQJ16771.1 acyl carrier protein [Aureicoccus marinus]
MDKNEMQESLLKIVKLYLPEDVSIEDVQLKSNFIQDLNINSAHLVDIVLDVEDEFGVVLENEDMDGMQTVEDALSIITKKLEDA